MNQHRKLKRTKSSLGTWVALAAGAWLLAGAANCPAGAWSELDTFGTAGKQQTLLTTGQEAELFHHSGRGCLTHMWFGGSFKNYERTRLRIYVDGETTASIDMELFLGHGIGFADSAAPWGIARFGKTGDPSGIYDTYRIPFGKSVRVTAQLAPGAPEHPPFWWIIRGVENLPVRLGGVQLPAKARLKLYKLVAYTAQPLEEFPLCDAKGDGALYEVTMAAKGLRTGGDWTALSFMEGCMRSYGGGSPRPVMLSSGLEDYFLGTYYFNKGKYYTPVAGLTHFDPDAHAFSAYRLHEDDPIFFHHGLRLTARCGEKVDGQVVGNPPQTEYTTYVWLYQW
jgi:hypothetical protein